jgi:alkylation response protein AidB-like acyl-CoA dehydrogenase
MPDHEFNADLRDIKFNLFEFLPFNQLTALEPYAELDRESMELVLEESFKFNREVLAPINRSGDQQGCTFADGEVRVPEGFVAAYRAFCDNNWLGTSTPEEMGGMGLPMPVGAASGELNVGACCSLMLSSGLTRAAAALIAEHASEELKKIYLPKLVSGRWQGTMCLTEAQAGTAVGDIRALAKPVDDGETYLVTGTKIFITSGEHDMCENHVHLVLARTPGAPKGFKGISLFLVPKFLPDASGDKGEYNDVVCAGIEHKLGIKASPTCTLSFGEEERCRGWLIGNEGEGLKIMFRMMNEARIGVGLQSLGLAAQAYLYAKDYANERVQGVDIEKMRDLDAPRVLISHHPDVRRMLLWCKAIVEGSRALLYFTAFQGELMRYSPEQQQAEAAHGLIELLTPICKAWVSDRAFEVTERSLQVMGGYGYIAEYPVEQHMRDVKIASIYEGTNGIQALDLLGRKLAAEQGKLFRMLLERMQAFVRDQRGHLALGEEVAALGEELGRWSQTTMDLGAMGMSGDRQYPVLSATPYLEMAGNAVVCWLLLQQAVIAHDRLQTLYLDQSAMDPAARDELHRADPDAQFYFNKIETARFFVHQVLSKNQQIAAQIGSGDRSALRFIP